jgi:hypothetical protein
MEHLASTYYANWSLSTVVLSYFFTLYGRGSAPTWPSTASSPQWPPAGP